MATTIITTLRNRVSERGSVPKVIRVSTPVYATITRFNSETREWEQLEDVTNIVKYNHSYIANPEYNFNEIWSHPDNYKDNVSEQENVTTKIEDNE